MKTIMKVKKVAFLIAFLMVTGSVYAQQGANPIIKNYGTIYEIENTVKPDPSINYKIVIDLKTLQRDKESLNGGLNNVARMINLHGLGGVSNDNLNVSVVIHGGATDVVLNNDTYKLKYEFDNPNIPLIRELKEAGVKIYVCGQSLLARNYPIEEVNTEVEIGLSMLTVVTTHLHNGYHQMVFN
ncbi:DsrE family protein [Balneola vulgaris]|uniref:DsrE family protein n=1 Tax=Balneola vulgaris TaxID=287535 RepID=UPI001969C7B6|nr:DsrE family protein [Balneola vulgaris]